MTTIRREQIDRILDFAAQNPKRRRGMWRMFGQREGLSKDVLFHWRKKLGLVKPRHKST